MKKCTKCGEEKEYNKFYKSPKGKDGLRSKCSACCLAYQASISKSPKARFRNYKSGAKQRNYLFDLTFKEFMSHWQKPCEYCNSHIETIGLDRIDNNKGYSIDNIVSCCYTCNRGKGIMGEGEFLIWIEKVYTHSIKGEEQ